jgi:hypothetical protein
MPTSNTKGWHISHQPETEAGRRASAKRRWIVIGGLGVAALALTVVATRHVSGARNVASQLAGPAGYDAERGDGRREKPSLLGPIGHEKQLDADSWGVSIPSDAFNAIEGDKFLYTHGRLNTVGQPLAGGGVVGKDDWRTINMNGRPNSTQMQMAEKRSEIFYQEVPTKDPVADAGKSASKGDWKFFIVPMRRPYTYFGEGFEKPFDFRILGLENHFGCNVDEDFMRRYGKRTLDDYYDGISIVAPSNKRGGSASGFEIVSSPLFRSGSTLDAFGIIQSYEKQYNIELYNILSRLKNAQLDNDHVAKALQSLKSPRRHIYYCHPK